jgi:hypothetical protein
MTIRNTFAPLRLAGGIPILLGGYAALVLRGKKRIARSERNSVAFGFFLGQQKQDSERPNAAHGAGNRPSRFVPTAVIRDHPA